MGSVNLSIRQKAILTGLFLSKFDEDGLSSLGFKGFHEAFNAIGYAIGVKPASIKNYRDEFDPYFPNSRKGWRNRKLRDYCANVMNDFDKVKFDDFKDIIQGFLFENFEFENFLEKIELEEQKNSIAKRLITGRSAEEYFKQNYVNEQVFSEFTLLDTTQMGCGFDFRLLNGEKYFCVEVKGLSEKSGSILLTEKEYFTAQKLKNHYCLFLVLNFIEKPFHKFVFNPLESEILFKRQERQVIQVNYTAII